MKRVSRDEYSDIIRTLPHDYSNALITSNGLSAMQWSDNGKLIAQAVYYKSKPCIVNYYVDRDYSL